MSTATSSFRGRKRDSQDDPNASTMRKKRKTACQSCRIRKSKCDAARPRCSICRSTGIECLYTDEEKLTIEAATTQICSRIANLQQSIDALHSLPTLSSSKVQHTREGETSNSEVREEPCRGFLQIPANKTSCDAVLTWPIFEDKFPPLHLADELFRPNDVSDECMTVSNGLIPIEEEKVPNLVNQFLENVHTKNPVLDAASLVNEAQQIAANGLGWSSTSCLVLIACALGCIAKPFDQAIPTSPAASLDGRSPLAHHLGRNRDLQKAESYFVLACRRLGTLKYSLMASQCHFFAGVYLMYTLRPLLSWQRFSQASSMYHLYMMTAHGVTDFSQLEEDLEETPPNSKQRRLEQCMYWSCFKSECEFRVELPLPQSAIASYHHPQLFPSPPTPNTREAIATPSPHAASIESHQTGFDAQSRSLCNEEESWYYYLTEIALRRIGNQIINTMYKQTTSAWINIEPFLDIALEYDTQVSAWSANLPPAMKDWETSYTIRAPHISLNNGGRISHVSRELSWATDNRLLEIRSWLYQPFLYYHIHAGSPTGNSLASNEYLRSTVERGIECNLRILDVRSLKHRHHGLWYDLRSVMTASLIMLAIIKSGNESWIPGGIETVIGQQGNASDRVAGRVGHALDQLEYWASECPSLLKHRDVLMEVAGDVARKVRARSMG